MDSLFIICGVVFLIAFVILGIKASPPRWPTDEDMKNNKGTTLVEVLVMIFMILFVCAGLFVGLHFLIKYW